MTFETTIHRTSKSREMHLVYKFPNITALTGSILTSPKREKRSSHLALGTYEVLHAWFPVPFSLYFDPREKPLEQSALLVALSQ